MTGIQRTPQMCIRFQRLWRGHCISLSPEMIQIVHHSVYLYQVYRRFLTMFKGLRNTEKVYLWPWSSAELSAVIQDSKLKIDANVFSHRYHKFGGIWKHVIENASRADVSKSNKPRQDRPTSVAFWYVMTTDAYKAMVALEFTSAYAEDQVQNTSGKKEHEDYVGSTEFLVPI